MILIAGLGNPEKEYKYTRHNIGFEVINKLAYDHNIEINKAKHRAHLGEGFIAGKKVLLAKPQTYMNLSGESIRDIMQYYKLAMEDLIVVYDDASIDLGDIRIRKKGSAGGHNGMKNIIYQLGDDEFTRVRVGIDEKPPRMDLKNYVLTKFKNTEQEAMVEGVTKATEAIELMLKDSVDNAMNRYNKRKAQEQHGQESKKEEKPIKAKKQEQKPPAEAQAQSKEKGGERP